MLSSTQEEYQKVLQSQGLSIHLTDATPSQYLSTVMSLVCRWPPFDLTTHNRYFYQRIKSEQIMRVGHFDKSKKQIGSDILIVPTDDERLKIVIIPLDALETAIETQESLDLTF